MVDKAWRRRSSRRLRRPTFVPTPSVFAWVRRVEAGGGSSPHRACGGYRQTGHPSLYRSCRPVLPMRTISDSIVQSPCSEARPEFTMITVRSEQSRRPGRIGSEAAVVNTKALYYEFGIGRCLGRESVHCPKERPNIRLTSGSPRKFVGSAGHRCCEFRRMTVLRFATESSSAITCARRIVSSRSSFLVSR